MFAQIASGHVDLADVLFLVATILFAIVGVVALVRGNAEGALLPLGLGFTACGLLVL